MRPIIGDLLIALRKGEVLLGARNHPLHYAVAYPTAPLPAFEVSMVSSVLTLTVALSLVSVPGVEPGTQLTYVGTMSGVKDDGNPAVKKFSLTLVAVGSDGDMVDFAWTLDETGRGSWTWLDHFGRWTP